MRFKHGIVAVAIVASFAAFAPSAMGAVRFTGASTAANQAFQGVQVTSQQFRIGTNYTTTCTGATFTGNTPNSVGPWSSISFAPAFTGCGTNIAGVNYATTVTCSGNWTLNGAPATLNTSTGAVTGGSITTGGTCTITLSGTSCVVTVPAQTVTTGINGQDRNAADTANSPSASAGASRIIANTGTNSIRRTVSGTGCSSLGGPAAGTNVQDAQYSGTVAIKAAAGKVGLWAVP